MPNPTPATRAADSPRNYPEFSRASAAKPSWLPNLFRTRQNRPKTSRMPRKHRGARDRKKGQTRIPSHKPTPAEPIPKRAQAKTTISTTPNNATDRPEQRYQTQPHEPRAPSPPLWTAKLTPQASRPPEHRRKLSRATTYPNEHKPATSKQHTKGPGLNPPQTTKSPRTPLPARGVCLKTATVLSQN